MNLLSLFKIRKVELVVLIEVVVVEHAVGVVVVMEVLLVLEGI